MSSLAHSLLAIVDASKNDLKCSLTNYIDFTVENQFGQLRNRILSMIESGVLGDGNALMSAQPDTTQVNSSNQQTTSNTLPSESLGSIIATEPNDHRIKREWLDTDGIESFTFTFNQITSAIKHVRAVHFHLPRTVREQNELNIIDDRDAKSYVQVS